MRRIFVPAALLAVALNVQQGAGQTDTGAGTNLFKLPFEELIQIPVTVASRAPETVYSSPGTVYVVTEEDIRLYGWRDLSEILNATVPNLFGSYDGHKHRFGARGFDFDGMRVLIMIDGRMLTGIAFANAAYLGDAFSAANIKRVEVLMGPNSTLYGSSALESVVNVITRSGGTGVGDTTGIQVIRGTGNVQQHSVVARRVTADSEIGFHYSEYVADQNWPEWARFYGGNSFIVSRPPPDPGPSAQWQQHKEDRMLNIFARYKDVYAGYNYWRIDASPDVFEAPWAYTTSSHGRRDIWEFCVPYMGYTHVFNSRLKVNAEIEYRYFTRDKIIAIDAAGQPSGKVDYERQMTPVYKGQIDWTPGRSASPLHRLTFGGEYRHAKREFADRIPGADGGEFGVNSASTVTDTVRTMFAQDVVALVPERLTLTAGLSYNSFASVTNAGWAPRASLVWLTGPESAAKLTYGEGVREDQLAQRIADPERLRMLELNYSRGLKIGGLKLMNIAATYWMEYDNMSRSSYVRPALAPSGSWQNESIPSLRVYGVEDMLRLTWGRASAYVSVNMNDREEEPTRVGEMTAFVPAYMLKAGVSCRVMEHVSAAATAVHLGRTSDYIESPPYDDTAYERVDLPSWTSVDLNLRFDRFRLGGMDGALSFRVGNVFDDDGRTRYEVEDATGLLIEPRTFRVDLSLSF